MSKIRLALLALLLCGLAPGVSFADTATVNTPKSEDGREVHPLYGGFKYAKVAGTVETVICTGYCLLGEVYMSTGRIDTNVVFRDTSVANGNGATVLTRIFLTDTATSYEPRIHRSLRFNKGITAQLSANSAYGEDITVSYMELGNN